MSTALSIFIICLIVVCIIVGNLAFLKKALKGIGQEFFCKDCIHCVKSPYGVFMCKNNPSQNSDLDYKVTGERFNGQLITCAFVRHSLEDKCGYLPKEELNK